MAVAHLERAALAERSDGKKRGIEYRLIFLITFGIFLIAALVELLLPWRWFAPRRAGEERAGSIFAQAKESAGRCTAYAFMG